MSFLRRTRAAILLAGICALLIVSIVFAQGILNFIEAEFDGQNGVNGLDGVYAVVVSPDGKHVYTAATFDDAVSIFARDPITGTVDYLGLLVDNFGGVDGLEALRDLAISPDGEHIYTAGLIDDAVAVFSRDAITGLLTFVEAEFDGVGGVSGIDGADAVVVSPDGNHVYVGALTADAIAAFARNSVSGELTFVEAYFEGFGGVDGIDGLRDLDISPDGEHIYTASNDTSGSVDNAVAVFSRDQITGELTYLEAIFDGVGGADGLGSPASVKVSPDGKHVYVGNRVAGFGEDWFAIFLRDQATGGLTFVDYTAEGLGSDCTLGIQGDTAIAFRRGGDELLLTSTWESGLYRFDRDSTTGLITPIEHICGDPTSGFFGTRSLAVSPDDIHIYGAAFSEAALSAFVIDEPALTINYPNGQPGSWFTVTGQNYPANQNATVFVNNVDFGAVVTDGSGFFTLLINTAAADEGWYFVTVTANPSATVQFKLDAGAPLRPQEGSGPILNLPAGIAFTESGFLPVVRR